LNETVTAVEIVANMTTRTDVLESCLAELNLNMPTCSFDISQALANPLDLYRSYLATILAGLVGCNEEDAFKSIQWPNNIFNGDLAVVLPKLQPGAKADKLAVELLEKVLAVWVIKILQYSLTQHSFPKITHSSRCLSLKAYIFASL
jgi:hypothetical protein